MKFIKPTVLALGLAALGGCVAVPVDPYYSGGAPGYYNPAPAYYPAPGVYAAPAYYGPPAFYGPSIGIGISGGWRGGGHRGGRWHGGGRRGRG
ncbi:MAG: hypothetical protein ACXWCY_12725 [Burkholderiales bacterium]